MAKITIQTENRTITHEFEEPSNIWDWADELHWVMLGLTFTEETVKKIINSETGDFKYFNDGMTDEL